MEEEEGYDEHKAYDEDASSVVGYTGYSRGFGEDIARGSVLGFCRAEREAVED